MIDRASYSILVVDDNVAAKYALSRGLRAAGYRTVEASAGAEALELSEFVSAVVLDVHLPDVHGYEVCRLIRKRQVTATL
ncbi:MAG: hybrid sensor histidine kinase/response regulator, partial [Ramlibacter sp.]|nr:hybrid sensor histidine kinase/response regulator [Ramlibacter sp.]